MKNNLRNVKLFEKKFNARVIQSQHQFHHQEPIRWEPHSSKKDFFQYNFTQHVEEGIEITMPKSCFEELVDIVEKDTDPQWRDFMYLSKQLGNSWINEYLELKYEKNREQFVRGTNPSVKNAWEEYQLLLKLTK